MDPIHDFMACLRAITEARIAAKAVTRAQIAETAQEHLLNLLETVPEEQREGAYPLLREIATSIGSAYDPSQRG